MDNHAGISTKSQCNRCTNREPVGMVKGVMVHLRERCVDLMEQGSVNSFVPCGNFDAEGRYIIEPFGYYVFAWLPKRCRNGKLRWLCWIEQHYNGTFTLGNRAY